MARQFTPGSPDLLKKLAGTISTRETLVSSKSPKSGLFNSTQYTAYSNDQLDPSNQIPALLFDKISSSRASYTNTYRKISSQKKPKEKPVSVDTGGFVDRPRAHVPSPIQFVKQTARHNYKRPQVDVSPGRFIPYNTSPLIFSKTQRIPSPDFRKQTNRYDYLKREALPEYEINLKSVWRKVSNPGPSFGQLTGRKSVPPNPIKDVFYENIKYHYVDKRSKDFDLELQPQRPQHKVLPMFMLKVEDRNGLNLITERSLKENCYQTGRFQSVLSTFDSRRRSTSPTKFEARGLNRRK